MNASVIIPTHNRVEVLSRVLAYYGLQELDGERFEVVLVDDGSTDETPSLFKRLKELKLGGTDPALKSSLDRIWKVRHGMYGPAPAEPGNRRESWTPYVSFHSRKPIQLKYAQIEKSGRSVARNVGIALSSAPLIIFADDDIFVENKFVKKHLAVHLFSERCVVMGQVIHTASLENPFSARWKLKDINTAFLSTGNASVPKRAIIEAGMFDEGYTVYGWEDFDLGIHLLEHGIRSLKRPIYGYHYDPPRSSFVPGEVYRKEKERGFTAVYFYKNHPLRWVRRFTLVNSLVISALIRLLGRNNWFLAKNRVRRFKGPIKLLVRYKGYFDGIAEGKKHYLIR